MSVNSLRIIVGVFLLLLGIAGISPKIEESIFSLNNKNLVLESVFGIVEIICSLVILMGLFIKTRKKTVYTAGIVVFWFYVARIVLSEFIWSTPAHSSVSAFISWALLFSAEIIIASTLWILAKAYKS
ncbi:MAG TPA: hypothetical protein PK986_02515 [Spirochaetota bacterium]|nr:hypothetical protein [Spirochaetota bacterium]HQO39319.1 hypothetical protein [Spirochaetota bacterium]